MSWCTPSLAKPQIYFSCFQLSFSRAHSELKAWSSEGYVALEPNCFLLEGRGGNWSPVENERPAAGWPPGQTLSRKSGRAAPPPSRRGKESAPVNCYLRSWGGGLKDTGQYTAPPCPGGGGQGARAEPTACANRVFLPPSLVFAVFAKAQCPHLCILPSSTSRKEFLLVNEVVFILYFIPPDVYMATATPKTKASRPCACLCWSQAEVPENFAPAVPSEWMHGREDTPEFTNEKMKAGSG